VQLLDNLLDNAFRHGGPDVELRAFRRADRVVLAVQDHGPGVPEAWRSRVFDPFQRVPAKPGSASTRGAGLGLAVCAAIARAHGGTLELRYRPGGGSSFEVSLPVEPLPADRPGPEAERTP
jgi:two-component system sensor histidine kinase KdpD